MEHNGLQGNVAEDDVLRGVGGKGAALLGKEGLRNGVLRGPDLGVAGMVDEVGEGEQGSDGVCPGVGLGVHLEQADEEAKVVPGEAARVGNRPRPQRVVACSGRKPRGAEVGRECVGASSQEGGLEPGDEGPRVVLGGVGTTLPMAEPVGVPAGLEIRAQGADVADHLDKQVEVPSTEEAVVVGGLAGGIP